MTLKWPWTWLWVPCTTNETKTSCRWQTCATLCVTTNVLQTSNVDAQCDKLATELRWQRFASKFANLQLPHLHLTYPICIWRLRWGWPRMSFAEIFSVRKLASIWAIVWHCLRDPTFSRFSRTPTCDGRTNRQTNTRRHLISALASVGRVKICYYEMSGLRIWFVICPSPAATEKKRLAATDSVLSPRW